MDFTILILRERLPKQPPEGNGTPAGEPVTLVLGSHRIQTLIA
jgi:hypothetical protein